MESEKGKWLQTKDDGVLLFKNISFSIKEADKEEKKEVDYEHNEANCVITFDENICKFNYGTKLFHTEMGAFCTVTERVDDENGNLKQVKIRLDSLDSEAVVENTPEEIVKLTPFMDIHLRIVQKSGSKFTIKSKYNLSSNMKENLKNIFGASGFKEGNFKIFNNDKLLDKNSEFEQIFQLGKDTYLYAFESLGVPKKWKRFRTHYEYSTWSNSGNSSDGIIYIATKALTIAGFVSYAAKDDPDYELKYKLEIDGVTVEECPPKKYSNWEETFFKTVMFENTYDVNANARVTITIWMSRNFSSSQNVNTYYGTDGYNWSTVENEHMGLFTVESSGNSSNGTSISSGQIPAILYYVD